MKADGVMPSGGCHIVTAEYDTAVAKQYFISASTALPLSSLE